ncbi:MAG: peptidoglycan-associated lipoprotein Pal [Myxococcota bacterium]
MKFVMVSALFMMSACHQSTSGTCKKDTDCKEGVCVFGKCQECAVDADCKDGKTCQNAQCLNPDQQPKTCTDSGDCGTGMVCAAGICAPSTGPTQSLSCAITGVVHFDFNGYDVKSDTRDQLNEIASCMRSNPGQKFVLSGNTDERGTVEYNLALGEKRAQTVAQYLQNSGIDGSRMTIISYGKEKPVDTEHNEEAWSKNRRTDITLD